MRPRRPVLALVAVAAAALATVAVLAVTRAPDERAPSAAPVVATPPSPPVSVLPAPLPYSGPGTTAPGTPLRQGQCAEPGDGRVLAKPYTAPGTTSPRPPAPVPTGTPEAGACPAS